MAHVIIGVHGLGNKPKPDLLRKWWRLSMEEGLRLEGKPWLLPSFELAYWADITWEKPLSREEKDPESPYYLDDIYTKAPRNFSRGRRSLHQKIIGFAGKQLNRLFLKEDYSLNYTSLTDTIIGKYFRDLDLYYSKDPSDTGGEGQSIINQLIRERLSLLLEKHKNDEIILIGHSMGSIIAYDVLTFIKPEIKVKTLVTIGSPLGLPLVQSRIAGELKERGSENPVLSTPANITGHWINQFDSFDNVSFNYRLSEFYEPNSSGIAPDDVEVVNDYEVKGRKSAHKSYGYLRTPQMASILHEFIISEKLSLMKRFGRRYQWIVRAIRERNL